MFGHKILDYWDDIVRDLGEMIAIPSVCGKPDGIYPYGKAPAQAIDKAVELARSYGFETKNVDYYAAHAQYGEGEENAVVMAHLDVVPEGDGWISDPYTLTERDGYLFGRGVADNKGPAIIALHCLRALKDAGVQGKRKLRVVFGSGEEIGMDDMKHYFASEQRPTIGFTPDGHYGICHCEKGLLRFEVIGDPSPIVRSFRAGTVVNAVPAKAEADILCPPHKAEAFLNSVNDSADFECNRTKDGLHIVRYGIAAHASAPQKGLNAASCLVEALYRVFGEELGSFYSWIHNAIGLCYDGRQYGVDCADEVSGPLTFNLGLVQDHRFTVDIRYPATISGQQITATLRERTEAAGLTFHLISDDPPLYLPKDSKLVQLLSGAYQDVTGQECSVYSMGGGTYARQMFGNGVAFGANFEGENTDAHNCNEKVRIERMKLHAQICLEAMYRLLTAE